MGLLVTQRARGPDGGLIRAPYEGFLEIFGFLGMLDRTSGAGRCLRLRLVGATNRAIRKLQHSVSLRLRRTPVERPFGKKLQGISPERLRAIVRRHDFTKKSGGRAAGEEDVRSHYRKGVVGDWRNHFKAVHVEAFKANYGDLLVRLGYESDDRW